MPFSTWSGTRPLTCWLSSRSALFLVADPWSVILLGTLAWGIWRGYRRWPVDGGWLLGSERRRDGGARRPMACLAIDAQMSRSSRSSSPRSSCYSAGWAGSSSGRRGGPTRARTTIDGGSRWPSSATGSSSLVSDSWLSNPSTTHSHLPQCHCSRSSPRGCSSWRSGVGSVVSGSGWACSTSSSPAWACLGCGSGRRVSSASPQQPARIEIDDVAVYLAVAAALVATVTAFHEMPRARPAITPPAVGGDPPTT